MNLTSINLRENQFRLEKKNFAISIFTPSFFYRGFMQFYDLLENALQLWFELFAAVAQKLPAVPRLLYGGYEIRT